MGSSHNSRRASVPALPLWHKLLVGASAGIAGTSLIYPLDILKTRLQSSPTRLSLAQGLALLRGGGLYRGFSACLVGIAPEKAIKLAANDALREHFLRAKAPAQGLAVWEEVAAGSVAGFLQLFVTVPYESVKIRLQMHAGPPLSALRLLQQTRHVSELYAGFGATLLRDVPFCLLFFPLYAQLKALQARDGGRRGERGEGEGEGKEEEEEPFYAGLLAGVGAGAVSAVLVTPADMLKTRIQQGLHGGRALLPFARAVVRAEGAAALFRGWQTRMLVIAPLYGLVSLCFEAQKRWLAARPSA